MDIDKHASPAWVGDQLINQLTSGLKLSLNSVSTLFAPHASITWCLSNDKHDDVRDMIGFPALKNTLTNLLVDTFYYHDYRYHCQWVQSSYHMTIHGIVIINNKQYPFYNTILFRKQDACYIIDYFILYVSL